MTWLDRMSAVMAYIEDNLQDGVSVDEAAKRAHCSKFHFHRVFHAYFDITFAEYVRRRKFTLAVIDVIRGTDTITSIALQYGYESPNAFTRAFRHMHGVNPSEARRVNAKVSMYHRASFPPASLGAEKMDYKIVEVPAFTLVGKSKNFNFEDFKKTGKKFWKDYVASDEYKSLCGLTDGKPGKVSGASLLTAYFPKDNEKRDEFTDLLGVEFETKKGTKPFETHTVPAGTYAEFECPYISAMKTNRYIYGEWFDATGFERAPDKPDIVSYFPMPWQHFSQMTIRWWIPVVRK